MANFEKLIRGAIAAKKATTAEARADIYQSSRNALQRLIDTNRSMTVENAVNEQRALEEAIQRIEDEFSPPPPLPPEPVFEESIPVAAEGRESQQQEPQPVAEAAQPQESEPEAEDPLAELKEILLDGSSPEQRARLEPATVPTSEEPATSPVGEQPTLQPEPSQPRDAPTVEDDLDFSEIGLGVDPEYATGDNPVEANVAQVESADTAPPIASGIYEEPENMPMEFARRRRNQRRLVWLVAILAILALLAWLAFYLYSGLVQGNLLGLDNKPASSDPNATSLNQNTADYITVLEPTDLSSLITAGRGTAEIVSELNQNMVRLMSVREEASRDTAARPILLRLQPGVLEQISGKTVTFEIYAKSGSPRPAQFTVKCQFGELGSCGRKRFRVGLQPEASIFAFDLKQVSNTEQKVYIAISTDTTAAATTTGKGDAIDIVYARLRPN